MSHEHTRARLVEALRALPVVDAHEHLPRESTRLTEPAEGLTFYRQYTRLVMFSAGLPEADFERMHDLDVPWPERLAILDRVEPLIRHSGPAQAARIALERFYGETALTRDNYEAVNAAMAQTYTPGLYRRVLGEACGIRAVVQNSEDPGFDDELLAPVPMLGVGGEWATWPELATQIQRGEHGFDELDAYVDERRRRLRAHRERGAVAFKHIAHRYCEPDRATAEAAFHRLRAGDADAARADRPSPLCCWLTDQLLTTCGELGVPVAVHTGVWGDFRETAATEMIGYVQRHPEVRFDLFHMGLPQMRATGRMGANFANVWLNMCWAPTLSPAMAAAGLDEWLDQVGANKISAFGGDVRWPVEKVYGHLELTRRAVADALARRVHRDGLAFEDALALAGRLFLDNPAALYGLHLP